MSNLLDLTKKTLPEIVIVEKIVSAPRSIAGDFLRAGAPLLLVFMALWGITLAEDNVFSTPDPSQIIEKPFSSSGVVSDFSTTTNIMSITSSDPSDDSATSSFSFDASSTQIIQTSDYVPLALSDIQVGDNIIVQGTTDDVSNTVTRIVDFTATSSATLSATTTPDINALSTDATSTDDVIATSTDATSTPSDLDLSGATTTDATTTDASSTDSDATSSPSIIDEIIGVATSTIQNIVNAVTGGSSTPDTSTPDVPPADPSVSDPAPAVSPVITPDASTPPASPAPDGSGDSQAAPDPSSSS